VRIVIDMNLSPAWTHFLSSAGHEARHWSAIGEPNAPDPVLLRWCRDNDSILFTHDLDFGAILAASGLDGPSVVQLRISDPTPGVCGDLVLDCLARTERSLLSGALVTIDERRKRIRVLPLRTRR
jgi:predicted nuclease of predicted toxin-antitoxin system